jgi:hypothetical protein
MLPLHFWRNSITFLSKAVFVGIKIDNFTISTYMPVGVVYSAVQVGLGDNNFCKYIGRKQSRMDRFGSKIL